MDIGLGMSVYTSGGQGIGSVDRLILDPDTNQVKAAVIRKGRFLPHDKEVVRELFDVLKVEAPVNLAFVEGTRAFRGRAPTRSGTRCACSARRRASRPSRSST